MLKEENIKKDITKLRNEAWKELERDGLVIEQGFDRNTKSTQKKLNPAFEVLKWCISISHDEQKSLRASNQMTLDLDDWQP